MQKILLTEDDVISAKLIDKFLTKELFVVERVENGFDCLQIIPAFVPDLLILDLSLPKMSGIEVLEWLKTSHDYKDIPVLVLTASRDTQTIKQITEYQIADFVLKPVNAKELLVRIRQALFQPDIVEIKKMIANCHMPTADLHHELGLKSYAESEYRLYQVTTSNDLSIVIKLPIKLTHSILKTLPDSEFAKFVEIYSKANKWKKIWPKKNNNQLL